MRVMSVLFRQVAAALLLACAATAEQSPFYQAMMNAYEEGRTAEARLLALRYLERSEAELANADNDLDRDGAMRRALDLVTVMMRAEAALPVASRFGRSAGLVSRSQRLLLAVDRVAEALQGDPQPNARAYFADRMAVAGRDWLRAAAPRASAELADSLYRAYADELQAAGYGSRTEVQQDATPFGAEKRTRAEPKRTPAAPLSAVDGQRAGAAARRYLQALFSGDEAGLQAVVGASTGRLAAGRAEELNRAGIQFVTAVQVPPLDGGEVARALRQDAPGRYSLAVPGIRLEGVASDGSRFERTVDKTLQLRRSAEGRWSVVVEP